MSSTTKNFQKPKNGKSSQGRRFPRRAPQAGGGAIAVAFNEGMTGLPKMKMFGALPFPAKFSTRLRYVQITNLTTGAGGIVGAVQQFRLNSLFDPDLTGTGHQPNGFDQITPLYNKYRVNAVSVSVVFTTPGATSDIECLVHFMPSSATPSIVSLGSDVAMEKQGVQGIQLTSSGQRKAWFNAKVPIWALVGRSKREFESDPNFYATVGASPTTAPLLEIALASFSGVGAEAAVSFTTLEFDVEFSDRIEPASS